MKIAVVGAGISGLTFAAAMQRFSPSTQVDLYEQDETATSRLQGYSLGLYGDLGLMVLKKLGLYDQLSAEATTVTKYVFLNQHGQRLLVIPAGQDEKRLTQWVERRALKTALLEASRDISIHYGLHVTGYQQDDNGINLRFGNGPSVQADFLIACDGAASVIRDELLEDSKQYLGLTAILGNAPLAINHPLLDGGYFMTLGEDGSSLLCFRQPDKIQISYTVHCASADQLAALSPGDLYDHLVQALQNWHAPIPEIVSALDPSSVSVRGYFDKEPARRVRDERVWLVGDAAHPMCPFRGQGANLAMVDSLKLAEYFGDLATTPATGDAGTAALEADIVSRGRKAVLASRNASRQFHATSRLEQGFRNVNFLMSSLFIGMASRK